MIYNIYYLYFVKKYNFHYAKFCVLNKTMGNIFFSKEYKKTYFYLFSKIQKIYFCLIKFIHICKIKKTKLQVDTDLSMNSIHDMNDRNKIYIIQNNAKYLFSISDLINIIENSITHAINFFVDPIMPKNPYTNMIFNNSDLYNIYFYHKNSTFILSHLFHLWFLSNFNLDYFITCHEAVIRDFLIYKFIFNSPVNILHTKVLIMLNENPFTRQLNIHKNFPKKMLVDIMRPFLFCKYMYKYGIMGLDKTRSYEAILYDKLYEFYKYNHCFGRLYYKLNYKNSQKCYIKSFNSDHIKYDMIQLDSDKLQHIEQHQRRHYSNYEYNYADSDIVSDMDSDTDNDTDNVVDEDVFSIGSIS